MMHLIYRFKHSFPWVPGPFPLSNFNFIDFMKFNLFYLGLVRQTYATTFQMLHFTYIYLVSSSPCVDDSYLSILAIGGTDYCRCCKFSPSVVRNSCILHFMLGSWVLISSCMSLKSNRRLYVSSLPQQLNAFFRFFYQHLLFSSG